MFKSKTIIILLVILSLIILTIIFYPTPKTGNQTTDTLSTSFTNTKEKIAFLKQYVNLPSEIEASEYHIVYFSGSGLGIGPSEWDFEMVFRLEPKNLKYWTNNIPESSTAYNLAWAKELLPSDWQLNSEPKYYKRSGELTVFEPEAIIFWKISTIDPIEE